MSGNDHAFVPTTRQWLVVVVGLIVLLGAGLYLGYATLHAHARRTAEQQLHSVASLKSLEIQRWLNDRLVFLGEPPDSLLARSFVHLLNGREAAAASRLLKARFRHLQAANPEINSIWLYDQAGHPYLGSNPGHSQFDTPHRDAAHKLEKQRQAGVVDLHRVGGARGEVVLDILVPLIVGAGPDAAVTGYVLFQIDPRQKLYPMIRQWPVPSATAESFLVRREGNEVVYLSPLRHADASPLSLRRSLDAPGFIAGRALQGAGEMLAGTDYSGEPAVGVALSIPGTEWMLITKMDDSEIYQEARSDFLWLSIAGLASLALLLILGRVVAAALHARAREEHYRMLAECGSDMVWLYDIATRRFTYVSPSVERMRGYTVAEAMQQTLQEVLTPASYRVIDEDLPKWLAAFAAGDESVRTRQYQLSQPRKDGTTVDTEVAATLIADAQGRATRIQGISRDITERRRIEKALAESEAKFRTIYGSINDAVLIHDLAGRIVEMNPRACQMFGYSREEMLGLDVSAISGNPPSQTRAAIEEINEHIKEHGWRAIEWLACDSTGRQFWVGVNIQAIMLDGAQRILAVVRDIDSRKRAEEDLRRTLAAAQALNGKLAEAQNQLLQSEKMASIGQLAAGVAHEINNPIGFVSSNLGTLETYLCDIFAIIAAYEAAEAALGAECAQLDAARTLKRDKDLGYLRTDVAQLMAESKDGLARVAKIVRDLRDFSRAGEAGSQWADLHQGLDSTLNIVWNELKYKCTVTKQYGELPRVWCVPSQLNQVFMNLLINAAQAIPEKGEITLRTGRQDDQVFVAVSDTGSGIAPEHLNRIFDPFFTTKPVGKGTGLGLSLAYSIVQKHQGRFEVHSELGKGSTFIVWLPIQAADAERAAAPAADAAPGLNPAAMSQQPPLE